MRFPGYKLRSQTNNNSTTLSYMAEHAESGRLVEIRDLSESQENPEWWREVSKRLSLAAMLKHPAVQQICELGLECDPPFVALEWIEGRNWVETLGSAIPLPLTEGINLVLEVADVHVEGHRLGLANGSLFPWTIHLTASEEVKIDFAGLGSEMGQCPAFLTEVNSRLSFEFAREPLSTPARDVFCFGILLDWVFFGHTGGRREGSEGRLRVLIEEMTALVPANRPTMKHVRDSLVREAEGIFTEVLPPPLEGSESWQSGGRAFLDRALPPEPGSEFEDFLLERGYLGRFQLLEKLGQGGMGTVYRAFDPADGSLVAVKVLRKDWIHNPDALKRFQKEARLLAEVNNPHVTNLLEVNQDTGLPYIVMEYVTGKSVRTLLTEHGQLDETLALEIMADVCRALVEAHRRGIVHRDIKPENILLMREEQESRRPWVKLSDFGMAKHPSELKELSITETGDIIGTPLYLPPEQCSEGGNVDARSDIYSIGATLYHLLAGHPPFQAKNPLHLISMHCHDSPVPLEKTNPRVSEGICKVVEKTLAKRPEDRYEDAEDLLNELERSLRGEPTNIQIHPRLPHHEPGEILRYEWAWQLASSVEELWPVVTQTDRFNRAINLPSAKFDMTVDNKGRVTRHGRCQFLGFTITWQENPFEWIEGQRFGVLREYTRGLFAWLISTVELVPRTGGGTLLTHRVYLKPRGLVSRLLAWFSIGVLARRDISRVYRRIDKSLQEQSTRLDFDPFEEVPSRRGKQGRRLRERLGQLKKQGLPAKVISPFATYLEQAHPQELARIRPLVLAQHLNVDPEELLAVCLWAVREGLLLLCWDLRCPVCRTSAQRRDSLRMLKEHEKCEACNLTFELDLAQSVEVVFQAHPEICDVDAETYCVGGPAFAPHVVAQLRVGPSERIKLAFRLPEGEYRLRGPQLPYSKTFLVRSRAGLSHWSTSLTEPPDSAPPLALTTGHQCVILQNTGPEELLVRLERTIFEEHVLSAARALAFPLFRELFPEEVFTPGYYVKMTHVSVLVTEIANSDQLYESLGDVSAFNVIREHFQVLEKQIQAHGAVVFRRTGEGLIAAFHDTISAVTAALELQEALARREATSNLRLLIGTHRGPAIAVNTDDRIDYFGTTVKRVERLLGWAREGEVLLTHEVASDPDVASLLCASGLYNEVVETQTDETWVDLHRRVRPNQQKDSTGNR